MPWTRQQVQARLRLLPLCATILRTRRTCCQACACSQRSGCTGWVDCQLLHVIPLDAVNMLALWCFECFKEAFVAARSVCPYFQSPLNSQPREDHDHTAATVRSSCKWICWYHSTTAEFGSVIMAAAKDSIAAGHLQYVHGCTHPLSGSGIRYWHTWPHQ